MQYFMVLECLSMRYVPLVMKKEKDRVKTLFFFHLHCNSSGPLMFFVEIFRLYHIFEDNDTLDLGIAAEN